MKKVPDSQELLDKKAREKADPSLRANVFRVQRTTLRSIDPDIDKDLLENEELNKDKDFLAFKAKYFKVPTSGTNAEIDFMNNFVVTDKHGNFTKKSKNFKKLICTISSSNPELKKDQKPPLPIIDATVFKIHIPPNKDSLSFALFRNKPEDIYLLTAQQPGTKNSTSIYANDDHIKLLNSPKKEAAIINFAYQSLLDHCIKFKLNPGTKNTISLTAMRKMPEHMVDIFKVLCSQLDIPVKINPEPPTMSKNAQNVLEKKIQLVLDADPKVLKTKLINTLESNEQYVKLKGPKK